MPRRLRFAAPLLLASLLLSSTALATITDADKATARELTVQGYDALKAKDWATAADRYTRAEKLFQAAGDPVPPTISLGVARAHAQLGKLVSAQEHYSRITHEVVPPNASPLFLEAVQDATRELPEVAKRVPGVVINVKGSDAPKVTIDGVDVSVAALGVRRPVDPGKHVVKATGVGVTPVEATLTLAEGATETVNLELKPGPGGLPEGPLPVAGGPLVPGQPPPAAEPVDSSASSRRKVGFAGIAIGGAGLIVGAITGGIALSKHSSLVTACPNGHCPAGSEATNNSAISSYDTVGNVSTAMFVVGGVFAVTGIVLVATARTPSTQSAYVAPVLSPGFSGLTGKF
jgi:hypothetical protein